MSNKICIVDDDSFYAEILANLLTMQGYEPKYFSSANECLESLASSAETTPYAAFILDVVMPAMDGYQLCAALRAQARFTKTPVLFVSSKNTLEDRMRGYESGGNDYLGKPVKPDELRTKLELAIAASGHKVTPKAITVPSEPVEPVELLCGFLERSGDIVRYTELAERLLEVIARIGLAGSVMVRYDENSVFISSDGSDHAIERELLSMAVKAQPVVEFNQRLMVNRTHVSLLIRRLPTEVPAELDQIKTLLDGLVRIANQRVTGIINALAAQRQKSFWLDLLVAAEKGLDQSTADVFFSDTVINEILEEFLISLNETVLDLALDKDQEVALKTSIRQQAEAVAEQIKLHGKKLSEAQRPFQDLITTLGKSF